MSINQGAIAVMGWQSCTDKGSFTRAILDAFVSGISFCIWIRRFRTIRKEIHDVLLHGTNGHSVKVYYKGQRGEGVYDVAFEGLIKNVERRYRETGSDTMKQEYETFMQITPCHVCKGQRLKPESLAVTVGDKNIYEITSMSIALLTDFMKNLELTETQKLIGSQILKEIRARVGIFDGCRTGISDAVESYGYTFRR